MNATGKMMVAASLAAFGLALAGEALAERGHRGGGHRHGAHGHWHGHGHGHRWRGHWGLYFGAPLVLGAAWGWPYHDPYYLDTYPRGFTYREREIEREPLPAQEPAPTTEVPAGEGAPTRGPLYMNYCESARAYFPKVTKCPEGWKLATPTG